METTTIKITARDLDTDARTVIEVEAGVPSDPAQQRTGLIGAVSSLHPEARIRSFADGAATFIDRQHLLVASYTNLPKQRPKPDAKRDQGRLFDEAAA